MKKEARQPFAPSGTDLEMSDKKPTTAVRGEAEEKSDFLNICLLLVLYTLQGVPMGLSGAIPFMLQDKAVSYADQSMFSLVSWPFRSVALTKGVGISRRTSILTALMLCAFTTQPQALLGADSGHRLPRIVWATKDLACSLTTCHWPHNALPRCVAW
eukprot:SAG11_NODE_346_length_10432_cov_4.883770_12_plen_157_part_00